MTVDTSPPPISRSTKTILLLLILLFSILVVLIGWPVDQNAPTWMEPFQSSLRLFTAVIAPFVVIGSVGGLVGVAELVSTFKTYPREALLTRWAWVLIFANVFAAIAALLILRATTPP